jgi:hypothetical protein
MVTGCKLPKEFTMEQVERTCKEQLVTERDVKGLW